MFRPLTPIVLCLLISMAAAQEPLPYRGINNSGLYPATGLMKAWPEGGPEMLWTYDLGPGYAGATVFDGKVYIAAGETNYVYEFDLDGRLLRRFRTGSAGWKRYSGTRSTILIKDGIAVTTTPDANIYGIGLKDQEVKWKVNAWKDFGAGKGSMGWGFPESPMLHNNLVIFNPCSRFDETPPIVAIDIETGKEVWNADAGKGKNYSAADVSGALVNHNGKHLVLYPTWRYLLCLDADTGSRLWEIPSTCEKTLTPVYSDGYVLWDPKDKAQMLKLSDDGSSYTVAWERSPLSGRFSHAVILDGRVYAFGNPNDEGRGTALLSLDVKTGKVLHHVPCATPGHVIAADGMVYALDLLPAKARGKPQYPRLRLLKPTKDGFEVTGEFVPDIPEESLAVRDVDFQASVNPVIAEGRLFVRYGPLMVFELRADKAEQLRAQRLRVAAMLKDLESGDADQKLKAIAELGELGPAARSAMPSLTGLLTARDERLAKAAARLMGQMGPAATGALIAALKDEAVYKAGDVTAALLASTPEDDDLVEVLVAAAEASKATRDDVKAILPRLGAQATPRLVKSMATADRFLRWWLIEVCQELGPDAAGAVEALAEVTRTGDQWFRGHAARALGLVGPKAAAATGDLVTLLKHPFADARKQAAIALGLIGEKSDAVRAALKKAASDEDAGVAEAAAAALKRLEP